MKLSIIIVNYNVQYFLEQCLLSVQKAVSKINAEIIVVDNNSKDGSREMIMTKFPNVSLIVNKDNFGFSRANNQGVEQATGEFILILNPDVILAEDTLENVLSFVEEQSNIGAVGVRFIDGTGNILPECKRNIPTIKISTHKLLGDSKNYYASHIPEKEIRKVEILTGAFMLMKREVYLKVGGFDEDYFMYGEDIDLSYKLIKSGYQNYYYGQTTIIHYKGESTVKDISYLLNFYGAMQIFYKKHYNVNSVYNLLSKFAIRIMIILKKISIEKKLSKKILVRNVLLISDNQDVANSIISMYPLLKVKILNKIPDEISNFDQIIFDSNFINYKEIIEQFDKLKSQKISKRIIPGKTRYYIGSDDSRKKGVIVEF